MENIKFDRSESSSHLGQLVFLSDFPPDFPGVQEFVRVNPEGSVYSAEECQKM